MEFGDGTHRQLCVDLTRQIEGGTPLHYAINHKQFEIGMIIINTIIARKMDKELFKRNKEDKTPYQLLLVVEKDIADEARASTELKQSKGLLAAIVKGKNLKNIWQKIYYKQFRTA